MSINNYAVDFACNYFTMQSIFVTLWEGTQMFSRSNVRQATGADSADQMQVLSATERYGSGAIAFHWIMVPLIVVVGVLGLLHDSWPKRTQGFWINIHALVGLLVWVSLIGRFWWRSRHPPPALPQDVGEIARRLSSSVHMLLYALIFIIPVIGVVTFVWHGRAFDFGLFQVNFGIRSNKAIFHPTEDIHGYLAYALFALAGMHVLAAVWHHLIRRDDVLRRMWPNLRKRRLARR